jgi:hypothetical protein
MNHSKDRSQIAIILLTKEDFNCVLLGTTELSSESSEVRQNASLLKELALRLPRNEVEEEG